MDLALAICASSGAVGLRTERRPGSLPLGGGEASLWERRSRGGEAGGYTKGSAGCSSLCHLLGSRVKCRGGERTVAGGRRTGVWRESMDQVHDTPPILLFYSPHEEEEAQ